MRTVFWLTSLIFKSTGTPPKTIAESAARALGEDIRMEQTDNNVSAESFFIFKVPFGFLQNTQTRRPPAGSRAIPQAGCLRYRMRTMRPGCIDCAEKKENERLGSFGRSFPAD